MELFHPGRTEQIQSWVEPLRSHYVGASRDAGPSWSKTNQLERIENLRDSQSSFKTVPVATWYIYTPDGPGRRRRGDQRKRFDVCAQLPSGAEAISDDDRRVHRRSIKIFLLPLFYSDSYPKASLLEIFASCRIKCFLSYSDPGRQFQLKCLELLGVYGGATSGHTSIMSVH